MLSARAFWMMRRSAGLFSGLGPPAFTAIVISLPMRAKALDILSQRANIVALRVSKMRPMRLREPLGHEPVIAGAEHLAHAPRAARSDHFVGAEAGAGDERHGSRIIAHRHDGWGSAGND